MYFNTKMLRFSLHIDYICPKKWWIWIMVAVLIRVPIWVERLKVHGYWGGDTESYLKPVENFLLYGKWEPDYRYPGYGLLYLLFRAWMPKVYAEYALLGLQTLMAAIAAYLMALTIYVITSKKYAYLIAYLLYVPNHHISYWDASLMTDSITASTLTYSLFLLLSSLHGNKKYIFWSGFFLFYSYLMRPASLICVPFYVLFLMLQNDSLKHKLTNLFLFLIPGLTITLVFIGFFYDRHKHSLHDFLFRYRFYEHVEKTHIKYLIHFDGLACYPCQPYTILNDFTKWDPMWYPYWGGETVTKAGLTFITPKEVDISLRINYFKNCLHTSQYNQDSLYKYLYIYNDSIGKSDDYVALRLDSIIKDRLKHYILSIKMENPIYYHITSRVISTLYMTTLGRQVNSGAGHFKLIFTLFSYVIFHLMPVILYFMFLVLYTFWAARNRSRIQAGYLILSLVGLAIAFAYAGIIRRPEARYLMSAYPFIFLGAMLLISDFISWRKFLKTHSQN